MNIFLTSDTHYGHANTFLKFTNPDGTPMRPFSSIEEMDDCMVERWNSVVRHDDLVYHLGDVVVNKRHLFNVGRLQGRKRLIMGNHDVQATRMYMDYFEEVYAMKVLDQLVLTHFPMHPNCVPRFGTNVHGHLHNSIVLRKDPRDDNKMVPDPLYLNVGVEQTNYTPLSLDEVRARILTQQRDVSPLIKPWGNYSKPETV